MPLSNIHVHCFTTKHVPDKFLPYGLPVLLKQSWLRRPLTWTVDTLWPFSNKDQFSRFSRFVQSSYMDDQESLLRKLAGFYPDDAIFSTLPMDMEFMGAGKVNEPLERQLASLIAIRDKPEWRQRLRLFLPIDPRRFGPATDPASIERASTAALEFVRRYVEEHGFSGIKLYPMLGYWACDRRLWKVYQYCEAHGLPITTHASRGGVYFKGDLASTPELTTHPFGEAIPPGEDNATFTDRLGDPDQFRYALQDFPKLKLNLAHYGGAGDWVTYLEKPWGPMDRNNISRDVSVNWVHKINTLLRDPAYPNVYTDISYTLFDERFVPLLKLFLYDEVIRPHVLYGTDFYMVEMDSTEREVAIQFRYWLGEPDFQQLQKNNQRFLG